MFQLPEASVNYEIHFLDYPAQDKHQFLLITFILSEAGVTGNLHFIQICDYLLLTSAALKPVVVAAEMLQQLEPEHIQVRLHSGDFHGDLRIASTSSAYHSVAVQGQGWPSHAFAAKLGTPCLQIHFEKCQLCVTSFSKEFLF